MVAHLNHDSAVPLYIQLKDYLQSRIDEGYYSAGARLPSERELAVMFRVSRMTARQALQLLAQAGVTISRVGKGTYVSVSKFNQEMRILTSFTEDMQTRGRIPSSRVLCAEIQIADEDLAHRLHIQSGAEIALLSRIRLADNEPLAIEASHLVHALCPGILNHDFSKQSLYRVLSEKYGFELTWADQVVEARLPNRNERSALGISATDPVLSTTRVTYTHQDQAIEFVRSVYRGDQYQLRALLRRTETP